MDTKKTKNDEEMREIFEFEVVPVTVQRNFRFQNNRQILKFEILPHFTAEHNKIWTEGSSHMWDWIWTTGILHFTPEISDQANQENTLSSPQLSIKCTSS